MTAIPAVPTYKVDDTVRYVDRQHRQQTGVVKRIEASWNSPERPPLIVYSVSHPTYRDNRIYITDSDIFGRNAP